MLIRRARLRLQGCPLADYAWTDFPSCVEPISRSDSPVYEATIIFGQDILSNGNQVWMLEKVLFVAFRAYKLVFSSVLGPQPSSIAHRLAHPLQNASQLVLPYSILALAASDRPKSGLFPTCEHSLGY